MQLNRAYGLRAIRHLCNSIKITMPASKSRSNLLAGVKVVMAGVTDGVPDGAGIAVTPAFKQIKSFIRPV